MTTSKKLYRFKDDGKFPNSEFPVIHYINVLELPWLLASRTTKKLFKKNGWTNSWRAGIYTYNHYHSNTHEVIGVIKGETTLLLGGPYGTKIKIKEGDVLVIPAGVGHRNLGKEDDVVCVGAYPNGTDYDIKTGKKGERPKADITITSIDIPAFDPVFGKKAGVPKIWKVEQQTKAA